MKIVTVNEETSWEYFRAYYGDQVNYNVTQPKSSDPL